MKPDGPVDDMVQPALLSGRDRRVVGTQMKPGWRPPDAQITQSLGVVFVGGGVVLVAKAHERWTFPGGGVEAGETPEEALVREFQEEACGTLLDFDFLCCLHVWDPDRPREPRSHIQSRWWARARLDDWNPQHEIVARVVVPPEEVLARLYYADTSLAARVMQLALEREQLAGSSL